MADGKTYLDKVSQAYQKFNVAEQWNHLMQIAVGVSVEDKKELLSEFPETPKSLLEILQSVDGTYYREYGDEEVTVYFFGSDVDNGEYPYYLCSAQQILEYKNAAENFADLFYYATEESNEDYGIYVDDRILMDASKLKWLCFSDCMNNGGTSSLYVDFTPSDKGIKGQIVRYLHDPDELRVIANSFDEFLDMLINNNLAFIHDDDFYEI